MTKLIHIRHMGNIGNRMFQFMFAHYISARVSDSKVVGFNIPGWGLECNLIPDDHGDVLTIDGGHEFNANRIIYLLNSGTFNHASLKVFAQRMEYLPPVEVARSWFAANFSCYSSAADHELLISVRGAEIMSGLHKDYMPLQLDYYTKLIRHSALSPVFHGQIDSGPYGSALRQRFPNARFLASVSPIIDFNIIYNAIHIVCSVSSFSWLAAWMSPCAKTIHLPLAGFLNPKQRPDVDLLPLEDPRYRFYRFPTLKWDGSDTQFSSIIIDGSHHFEALSRDDAFQLKRMNQKVVL